MARRATLPLALALALAGPAAPRARAEAIGFDARGGVPSLAGPGFDRVFPTDAEPSAPEGAADVAVARDAASAPTRAEDEAAIVRLEADPIAEARAALAAAAPSVRAADPLDAGAAAGTMLLGGALLVGISGARKRRAIALVA
jgi:hypothetical protein